MEVVSFTVGSFAVNNYLLFSPESRQAILIDAGEDVSEILDKISQLNLTLLYLINTHGHADHIAGNRKIVSETGARILIHELDAPFLSDPALNLSAYFSAPLQSPAAARYLKHGEDIHLNGEALQVRHTPGHTPGHISLITGDCAFVGDLIFQSSIGRTDFPFASAQKLVSSIRSEIYSLPDETLLYPGHGPVTTVGQEKRSNPFVSI
ncbi:MAG: MBL fold metallo-hydrolase [Calditrichia bacterium]